LLKILHRIAQEGWVERLPGNGWEFRGTITSRDSYERSYQFRAFRAAIESQALLLPTFRIDAEGFQTARKEQTELLNGGFKRTSRDHLFRANAEFHEMLMGCAHNEFFVLEVRRPI
jgi:DNA-binding GntR family transcriptional regulator